MRHNLIDRLKEEWAQLDPVDPLRGLISDAIDALAEQPAQQQEPVAFLANGTRFKIIYDNRQSGGQIHGISTELVGRWVAFVAADDDCHLKLTSPQPSKPLTETEIRTLRRDLAGTLDVQYVTFARAIEAKLREKNT